ncbi:MAG: tRNA (adenosine(37)-N6)-threonylcarbamoyltransferase complex transferase subunit TsaD [Candidatus Babeliales bacterium]
MSIILAFETSCDETAVAVYDTQKGVLANPCFSQIALHAHFGGVIPEIASRSHVEKIGVVLQEALTAADTTLEMVDAIAVTTHPGLPSALLVGTCYAKAIAWALHKPIIGVNHLEGHIFSAFLEQNVPFPHLCLTASGGHTALYLVTDFGRYELVAHTVDDAAGEAFDKVSQMIGLGYPGGPIIEQYAAEAHFVDFFQYPRASIHDINFSFSGLKTAVLYDAVKRNLYNLETKKRTDLLDKAMQQKIASSLLVCMRDIFMRKLADACARYPSIQAITFVGGVASNTYLKQAIAAFAATRKLAFYSPSRQFCTDNASMIAFVGAYKARRQEFDQYDLDIRYL